MKIPEHHHTAGLKAISCKNMCWEWSHDNNTYYQIPAPTGRDMKCIPPHTQSHRRAFREDTPSPEEHWLPGALSDPKVTRQQLHKEHCWNVAQRHNNKELMDHFTRRLVSFDAKLKVGSSNQGSHIPQSHTTHAFPHMNFTKDAECVWWHFYALSVNAPSSSVWPTTTNACSSVRSEAADSAAILCLLRTSENLADTQQRMCLMCQRGKFT